jgi:F0F1-type ATP synthase assembly protein I
LTFVGSRGNAWALVDGGSGKQGNGYQTWKLASVGIELGISVVLGWFVGRWADGKLHTTPWLMIAGVVLGFAAGLRSLVKTALSAFRNEEKK